MGLEPTALTLGRLQSTFDLHPLKLREADTADRITDQHAVLLGLRPKLKMVRVERIELSLLAWKATSLTVGIHPQKV